MESSVPGSLWAGGIGLSTLSPEEIDQPGSTRNHQEVARGRMLPKNKEERYEQFACKRRFQSSLQEKKSR